MKVISLSKVSILIDILDFMHMIRILKGPSMFNMKCSHVVYVRIIDGRHEREPCWHLTNCPAYLQVGWKVGDTRKSFNSKLPTFVTRHWTRGAVHSPATLRSVAQYVYKTSHNHSEPIQAHNKDSFK